MNSYVPHLDGEQDMAHAVLVTFQKGTAVARVLVQTLGDAVGAEVLAHALGGEDGDIEEVLAVASEMEENAGLIDVDYHGDPEDEDTEFDVRLWLTEPNGARRGLTFNFHDFVVGVEILSVEDYDEEDEAS